MTANQALKQQQQRCEEEGRPQKPPAAAHYLLFSPHHTTGSSYSCAYQRQRLLLLEMSNNKESALVVEQQQQQKEKSPEQFARSMQNRYCIRRRRHLDSKIEKNREKVARLSKERDEIPVFEEFEASLTSSELIINKSMQ